ncbi:MAG: aspartate--tRNA ligase [Fidelibacterota bacterium]
MFKRTHTCGELRSSDIGSQVCLNGWVATTRDHGGLIFVDIRDRFGRTQITFNEESHPDQFQLGRKLSMEDVISIKGQVHSRKEGAVKSDLLTGEIEVEVEEIELLNEAAPLPFVVSDRESATEDFRLKYRYLELRTKELQYYMDIRHRASQAVRTYLSSRNFIEIETPFLMRSTPEGARDYLVPSRIHKGRFYALPQSPQTYKQLLMISGFDRYFQIVRCFRDEDLRADRQPEFTQIDLEMSFIDEDDIREAVEGLVRHVFREVIDVELPEGFPVMAYEEALEMYGTDRPDIRFGLPLIDFAEYGAASEFKAMHDAECVKTIVIDNGSGYSRKVIDGLTDFVKDYSAQEGKSALGGLFWMRLQAGEFTGGMSKFFGKELQQKIISDLKLKDGALILTAAGEHSSVLATMGVLRLEIAKRDNLISNDDYQPVWITEFPQFEKDEKTGQWTFLHHPFTSPREEDMELLESDPGAVKSRAYDLVINGYEIAGGSIRNHNPKVQMKIFEILGMSKEEANEKFGFLLEALTYGAPPHGGIAFGYDRFVMLLAGTHQIRDVIAFPKTTSALSLMDGSPSEVAKEQLDELGIQLKK